MDNNNINENNKEEIKEDISVNRDNTDNSKDQIKDLYRRIEELKKSNKQLEAYKQETEAKKEIEALYKQYLFTEEEQNNINSLLKKYNIKDYKGYIADYYQIQMDKNNNKRGTVSFGNNTPEADIEAWVNNLK